MKKLDTATHLANSASNVVNINGSKLNGFAQQGIDAQFSSMFKLSQRVTMLTDDSTPQPPAFIPHNTLG